MNEPLTLAFRPPALPSTVTADELRTLELPPRHVIVDPIIGNTSLIMLYGPRGLGKTHVALGIAWAAATGGSFLKWTATRPHRVLYVDGEMPAADMRERLGAFGSWPSTLRFLMADLQQGDMPDLGSDAGQKTLVAAWPERPDLMVLDNLSTLVGSAGEAGDSSNALQRLFLLLRRCRIACLLVHHANKQGRQRGTSRREDVLDIVLALRRPADYEPGQGARFEVHFEKARGVSSSVAAPFEAQLQSESPGHARWQWRPLGDLELRRAVALLRDGASVPDMVAELGVSRSNVYRLRRRALKLGLLAPSDGQQPSSVSDRSARGGASRCAGAIDAAGRAAKTA